MDSHFSISKEDGNIHLNLVQGCIETIKCDVLVYTKPPTVVHIHTYVYTHTQCIEYEPPTVCDLYDIMCVVPVYLYSVYAYIGTVYTHVHTHEILLCTERRQVHSPSTCR